VSALKSSAFAVGLISALQVLKGLPVSAENSAALAREVEIERLGEPTGEQDQYASAYGGMNEIAFRADGTVGVEPITLLEEACRHMEELLVMLYTGTANRGELMPQLARLRAAPIRMEQRGLRVAFLES
jgi:D-glycero-alpha-D-manno-heptose-7-phosphate kinase